MYLGLDDTDGPDGMCTTFLMTKVLEEYPELFSDFPRLVRLNPNIPYRTRGNGALALETAGKYSKVKKIGYIHDNEVTTSAGNSEGIIDEEMEVGIWKLVKKYSASGDHTNPGLVIASGRDDGSFYREAVNHEIPLEYAISTLKHIGARVRTAGNGRGIVGAYSAISWPAEKVTYEVLGYRFPNPEPLPRKVMHEAASYAEAFDFTFNSMDYRNSHPSIFPNPRTPIIFGIRGTDPVKLLDLAVDINERFGTGAERIVTFRTNQGTDDHISELAGTPVELSSYRVRGRIQKKPHVIRGGHYFSSILPESGSSISIAAFEPTKEFRSVFSSMIQGDYVEVYGSFLKGTLNVEKLRIISLSKKYRRTAPDCSDCGSPMKNEGRFSYVCRKCGSTSDTPEYSEETRTVREGFYEVPVCARRHLSAPLSLMEVEQPLD